MGTIESQIVLDAEVASSLFSLTPPLGFELEIREPATITEEQMLEFLTATAEFGGNAFPDSADWLVSHGKEYDAIFDKPKKQWTAIELKIADLVKAAQLRGKPLTIRHFVEDHAVEGFQ